VPAEPGRGGRVPSLCTGRPPVNSGGRSTFITADFDLLSYQRFVVSQCLQIGYIVQSEMDAIDAVDEEGDSNVHDPLNFIVQDGGNEDEAVTADGGNEDEAVTAEEEDPHGVNSIDGSIQAAVPNLADVSAIDTVQMLEGAAPSEGVFPVLYVWDAALRQTSQWPTQSVIPTVRRCSRCGTLGCRLNICPYPPYTMRVHACKYCGTVLLGKEKNGMCCGKSFLKRLSFRRQTMNVHLGPIYKRRVFKNFSMQVNKLFAFVHRGAQLRWSVPNMPSMLSIQGVDYLSVPNPNATTSYLWTQGQPSLDAEHHAPYMHQALANQCIQAFVPLLHAHLSPPAHIRRASLRQLFALPQGTPLLGETATDPSTDQGQIFRHAGTGPVQTSTVPSEMEIISIFPTGISHVQAPLHEDARNVLGTPTA
jgi:hypothetical protein